MGPYVQLLTAGRPNNWQAEKMCLEPVSNNLLSRRCLVGVQKLSKRFRQLASRKMCPELCAKTWIQGSRDPWIQGSRDPRIQGSRDPWIQRSRDPWLQRSRDPCIQGSRDPWIQGSRVLWIPLPSRNSTLGPPRNSQTITDDFESARNFGPLAFGLGTLIYQQELKDAPTTTVSGCGSASHQAMD